MALIKCSECGQEISDKAPHCPKCGYVVHKSNEIRITINEKQKKKIIAVLILVVFCIAFYALQKNTREDSDYSTDYNSFDSGYDSEEGDNASTIFSDLDISNFSASLGNYGGNMRCTVVNNNSYTVDGYFYVNFYDSSGNLLYNQLMPLPAVASGETVSCSTSIPKDDYPVGYDTVDFSQASLVKTE